MIILSKELEDRLEAIWYRLQQVEFKKGISQFDLDEKCIVKLETYIEKEKISHEKLRP